MASAPAALLVPPQPPALLSPPSAPLPPAGPPSPSSASASASVAAASAPASSPAPPVLGASGGAASASGFGGETFFGGVTSLAEQLDRRVLVVLTDGRHLVGDLASYDQFGSLVLERAAERHFARGRFCDDEMGVYLVRGENVCLVGELDAAREAAGASPLVRAEHREVVLLEEADAEERRRAGGAVGAGAGAGAATGRLTWGSE